jgi:hypothetical protein
MPQPHPQPHPRPRLLALLALLAAGALLAPPALAPAAAGAAPDGTATVAFGRPGVGSPFPPVPEHDRSANAKDDLVPRTVVLAQGGAVTYRVEGLHQPAVYRPGTAPGDIDTTALATLLPGLPPFIADAQDRAALGPLVTPPQGVVPWTTPAGTFAQPGRYLVICTFLPHFETGMYGWVEVKPAGD